MNTIFILWVIWTGAVPLDARPTTQYATLSGCLTSVPANRELVKENIAKLADMGITTTFLCLPAGTRP